MVDPFRIRWYFSFNFLQVPFSGKLSLKNSFDHFDWLTWKMEIVHEDFLVNSRSKNSLAPPRWRDSLCCSDLSQNHHMSSAGQRVFVGLGGWFCVFRRVYWDMKVPSRIEFPFKSTKVGARRQELGATFFYWGGSPGSQAATRWECWPEILAFCLLTGCRFNCISESVLVNPLLNLFFLAQPGAFPKIKSVNRG